MRLCFAIFCWIVFLQVSHASQSFLAADASFHTGALDNSHIRQFSYGGVFQAETEGPLRYTLGLSVRRASLEMTIAGTQYDVISFDIQMRAGLLMDTFHRNSMSPVLAVYGLGGANLLTSSAPPASASESQAAYGWGYEFEAGIRLRVGYKSQLRILGAYRKYQFSYGGQNIAADAFAGRLGLTF
jgi:hypothetical protein